MKKLFLLILGILALGVVSAQSPLVEHIKAQQPSLLSLQPLDRTMIKYGTGSEPIFTGPPSSTIRTDGQAEGSIVMGTTIYDLQTNSAVARRLFQHEGGALTAVYTMAQDASYTDRGTGYAYFDGTTWTVTEAIDCLEPIKTGWPNIGLLNGKEFDMSHDGTNYQMQQGFSTGIGLGTPTDWTFSQSDASVPVDGSGSTHGPIWPRLAINGNFIHIVSNYQITDSANIVNGVKAPFVYSRSTDGGASWAANIGLPNYDNTRTLYGSADDYDVDYSAGTTAIAHFGLGEDVSFWKSTDDGATWVHTYIDFFEYAPDYAATAPIDLELPTNDGSGSIVVDGNGVAHVAYAEGVVVNDATIGAAFQPGWIGLRYWTEGMDSAAIVWSIGTATEWPEAFDTDLDGNFLVGSTTTDAAYCRYVNNSVLNKPSISYDADNNIFITFSLPHDADTTFDGQSFRDIYVAAHKFEDPMETWSFYNITNTYFVEEAFATAGRVANETLQIIYQEDFEPGTALTNMDPADFANFNYIEWANPFFTGVEPVKHTNGFSVKQNFPNPFTDQTQIELTLKTASDVNVNVTNLLGENVWQNNYSFAAGIHQVTFDRGNLSSGVYFYTVTIGDQTISSKMIVE